MIDRRRRRIGDPIPVPKLHRAIAVTAVLIVVLSASLVGAATASAPAPPVNDNYLASLEINRPHSKLNRINTLKDVRDTASATVQRNLLDPCGKTFCPAGPTEPTACHSVGFGNTVWYDFYPDADGVASIRTSGFDNVISLYRFNPSTVVPDLGSRTCVHQGTFPSEQLVAKVRKGAAYTFQIGGAVGSAGTPAGGPLEMLFDYSVTPPGSLKADSTIAVRPTSSGISLISLTVSAPHRGARIQIACGPSCRPQAKKVPRHGSTAIGFPKLKGTNLPAGTKLQIRVSAPHLIGVLIQYNIVAGNFRKQAPLCTEPGSKTPRRTCH